MAIDCSCIDEEQRKLILEAIQILTLDHKKGIDICKEYKIPLAELVHKEQIEKLENLEKEIKGLTSCKDLWSLIREEGKWWFSSRTGKLGPYKSESEAESYSKDFGIKYRKE